MSIFKSYKTELEPLKKELDEIAGTMTAKYLEFKRTADEQIGLLQYVDQEIIDTDKGIEWAKFAEKDAVDYDEMVEIFRNIDELEEDKRIYKNIRHAKVDRAYNTLRPLLESFTEIKRSYKAKFVELETLMSELENKRNADEFKATKEQLKGVYVAQINDMDSQVTTLELRDKFKSHLLK